MNYNIHPMVVHFPIALLVIYTFIKVIPFKKWFPSFAWKNVEQVLLFFGVLGAFAASSTGEIAEHLVRPDHDLVETHAFFAAASTWLYGLLLLGEISAFLNKKVIPKNSINFVTKLFAIIEKVLCEKHISVLLAIFGLVSITITGLLGGVMVYGVTADPIAPIVLQILGLSV